jgi:NAD(P)H-hydrate epimerase
MVLGPGIGRSEETNKTILLLMEASAKARKPVLVDADALRALAESKRVLAKAKAVITPHAGEFKAISGEDAPQELRKRISLCKKFAADYSCVLLLKGHNTIVSDGNRTKVNPTGNPGMAVGGTGDVLSGIIGAFLAQGAERFQAAVAGAYVHGLTGDLVHRRKGFHMMASDLIEALPSVLQAYDRVQRN